MTPNGRLHLFSSSLKNKTCFNLLGLCQRDADGVVWMRGWAAWVGPVGWARWGVGVEGWVLWGGGGWWGGGVGCLRTVPRMPFGTLRPAFASTLSNRRITIFLQAALPRSFINNYSNSRTLVRSTRFTTALGYCSA